MGQEIERRFLVRDPRILDGRIGNRIVQGYVAKEPGAMTTRVRIRDDRGILTLKGPRQGLARDEFEYPIPVDDAWRIVLEHCGNRVIAKTRYLVEHTDLLFEVDVFEGRHSGLVIAELELSHEEQAFTLPSWIGEEITGDRRFGNFCLAQFEGPVRPDDRPAIPLTALRPPPVEALTTGASVLLGTFGLGNRGQAVQQRHEFFAATLAEQEQACTQDFRFARQLPGLTQLLP